LGADGRVTEETYCGADGRAVQTRFGYARYTVTYGAQGQETARAYYGLDGRRVQTRVTVLGVTAGGVGERVGLRAGDVLLRYDGQPVTQVVAFNRARGAAGKGAALKPLVVLREGEERTIPVPPGLDGVELLDVAAPPGAAAEGRAAGP
jgi:S1-C subfamily serine protease